jgi:mono/diheme cytochrome c family protein
MARTRVAILTWLAGVLLVVSLTIVHTAPQDTAARAAGDAERHLATITQYCVACHNDRTKAAGVSFQGVTAASIGEHAETWEKALRKLRGRQMPPPGSRQPDQREIDAFVAWMEATLDAQPALSALSADAKASALRPRAGHVPIQRLTRTEFGAAVNDLLGIELDAESLLPAEIEVHGFDNIASALNVSPAFLDQYVAAARTAARLAVGEPTPKVSVAAYQQHESGDQPLHLDGLPLGTRGGMKFRHTFPADGEYRFTIQDIGVDVYSRVLETRHTLLLLVDGREVFRQSVGGSEDLRTADRLGAPGRAEVMKRFADIPVQVKAGTYDIAVTFIERARVESDEFIGLIVGDAFSRGDREPRIQGGVQVVGPFNSPGVSETPSRQRVFICHPERETAPGRRSAQRESDCARRIAANLARRAFRRPVTDADVDSLMPHFETGRKAGGFDSGIQHLVAAVLVSPDFLFRAIHTPAPSPRSPVPGPQSPPVALNDLELASRLSFFLWSQGPDEPLLDAATAGKLRSPEALRAQALRMLGDRRASALVRNFALKWLDVDNLKEVEPDPNLFPAFNDQLRRDMATEIEQFIASVLLEDRSVGDLLTADHTFINERLARHYGIATVLGPQFRRVTLSDPRRQGVLGKGAVLLRTSYGDRTSPVIRGAWVMDKLMGTPPTPPPPDVETDLSTPKGEAPKTLRARLESHRSKAGCNHCHGVIDPIGLALENFDAIGRWRDRDVEARAPIDAKTTLPNGSMVDGPAELRAALFGGRDLFVRNFTEKLTMYALGRELEADDMPQVRAIVRRAAAQNHTLSAIVSGIVSSDAFRYQAPPPSATVPRGQK